MNYSIAFETRFATLENVVVEYEESVASFRSQKAHLPKADDPLEASLVYLLASSFKETPSSIPPALNMHMRHISMH
jgi:hypothetical protein